MCVCLGRAKFTAPPTAILTIPFTAELNMIQLQEAYWYPYWYPYSLDGDDGEFTQISETVCVHCQQKSLTVNLH